MSAVAAAARPWRLGARARRAVLVVHVATGGVWLGLDVALGVLVGTALLTDDPTTLAAVFQVAGTVAVVPGLVAGLLALASGVLLGLGSKWGVVRYRWVAVKLAITVVLLVLVALALRPGTLELAERGRALAAGADVATGVGQLIFPPVVSTTALTFVMVLSVVKPWGRLRPGATVGGPGGRRRWTASVR